LFISLLFLNDDDDDDDDDLITYFWFLQFDYVMKLVKKFANLNNVKIHKILTIDLRF